MRIIMNVASSFKDAYLLKKTHAFLQLLRIPAGFCNWLFIGLNLGADIEVRASKVQSDPTLQDQKISA